MHVKINLADQKTQDFLTKKCYLGKRSSWEFHTIHEFSILLLLRYYCLSRLIISRINAEKWFKIKMTIYTTERIIWQKEAI